MFTKNFFPGSLNGGATVPFVGEMLHVGDRYIEFVYDHVTGSNLVLFVSHGKDRSLSEGFVNEWIGWCKKNEISVLLHNYPGHGNTTGPISEDQIMKDNIALVAYLTEEKHWNYNDIVPLGNSIGCGPTIALSTHFNFRKVVLISPYTSCFALLIDYLFGIHMSSTSVPMRLFSRLDQFKSYKFVEKLCSTEVLILHGGMDKIIPPGHSTELYELLKKAKLQDPESLEDILCIMKGVEHVDARGVGTQAIELFLKGDKHRLDCELERLREDGAGMVEGRVETLT